MGRTGNCAMVVRPRRRFQTLVESQDLKLQVSESRKLVIGQFGITERELRQIEEEGMEQEWPPL